MDRVDYIALPASVGTRNNVESGLKIQLDLAAERLEVLDQYLAYVYRVLSPLLSELSANLIRN